MYTTIFNSNLIAKIHGSHDRYFMVEIEIIINFLLKGVSMYVWMSVYTPPPLAFRPLSLDLGSCSF